MRISEMVTKRESIKRIMVELKPFTFEDLLTKQKVLITISKLEDMLKSLGSEESIEHIQITKRVLTRMDVVSRDEYADLVEITSSDKDNADFKKFIDTLESVWQCPSELLDKPEALDKIMEAYREIR